MQFNFARKVREKSGNVKLGNRVLAGNQRSTSSIYSELSTQIAI